MPPFRLFSDGVRRTNGKQSRRYNLLAARLVSEIVKNCLGPKGMDKMFIDIMGEVTVTKDGATLLRKIDVEHPAAKVLIEASNAVDNEVGDGTTSVVVLAGALVRKAEEMLDMGISPSVIVEGFAMSLEIALDALEEISHKCSNSDKVVMRRLVKTCLQSKALSYSGDKAVNQIVDAIISIANFSTSTLDIDDIKIEEKQGSMVGLQLVRGIVIDKTIDSSSMPKSLEKAMILLIDEDLEGKRTRTEAETRIDSQEQIAGYIENEKMMIRSKLQHIMESGANVVISRKGINTFAQNVLREAGIISVRRVKENDLLWLSKATGGAIAGRLDHDNGHDHHDHHQDNHQYNQQYHHADIDFSLGYAESVYEKAVGDDKMVFFDGCKNPRSVTLLLRANSKSTLDECHRSTIDALCVLKDFIKRPSIVTGGGSSEAAIARKIREAASLYAGREQIVIAKFADALEEIPITIAENAGMDPIDTLVQLRSRHASSKPSHYGIDPFERKVAEILPDIIEPAVVKEQVLKTAVEVVSLLVRVDDVLMAKPSTNIHTHKDGTSHSHPGGDKEHKHDYFDRLGKNQRPMHHYY